MDDQGGACPSIRIIFKKFILLYFQTSNDFDMEYTNNVFSNWQTTPHFYKIQCRKNHNTTYHNFPLFFWIFFGSTQHTVSVEFREKL